jgi:hypothetical protein
MRDANLDLVIIAVVFAIAYIRPTILVNFFNTNVGRFGLLACIVALSSFDTFWGLLGVLVLVCFRESITIEGMEGMNNDANSTPDAIAKAAAAAASSISKPTAKPKPTEVKPDDWRKKNCKANKVMLGESVVDMDEFAKKFPNVSFTNGKCNPCMSDCNIKITSATARLEAEEGVRSKPSNSMATDTQRQ